MRKDCVSREISREIVVGAFMVMILLGLGYFTIILSSESLLAKKVDRVVIFENVMGLRETDGVVVRGMPVGKVSHLELEPDGVHVTVTLDKPVVIYKDYKITVETTSMLGGRHMVIDAGTSTAEKVSKRDLLYGVPPHDIIADTGKLVNALKKGLIEDGAIDNLKQASADLRSVAARLNKGEGTLGRLLSADDTLYADFSATVTYLRSVAERLEKGEGTLGRLLSAEDTLYADLSATVASLKRISERLEKGEGTLGRLLSSDATMYEDLSASMDNLRTLSTRLEQGEGALGKLMSPDNDLYGELEEMVTELRATIDDIRETAPVTTFSSIFFGAF